jgi:hypothetical protein
MKMLLAAALLLVAGTASAPCTAGDDFVVSPGESVGGRSQAEWSRAWWEWAASFEYSESPVADRTGRHCHLGQDGPVWFLAGTYGTRRTIRTCTVPRGKYLFFPLINYVVFPRGDTTITCASATETARSITDQPSLLVLDLDGRQVRDLVSYRQATATCFDLGVRAKPGRRVFPTAANGYYVMLKPLSPGKHALNFGGVLPDMLQAVTYTLIVE